MEGNLFFCQDYHQHYLGQTRHQSQQRVKEHITTWKKEDQEYLTAIHYLKWTISLTGIIQKYSQTNAEKAENSWKTSTQIGTIKRTVELGTILTNQMQDPSHSYQIDKADQSEQNYKINTTCNHQSMETSQKNHLGTNQPHITETWPDYKCDETTPISGP